MNKEHTTARQAHDISVKNGGKQFYCIIDEIRKAAEKGEFHLGINGPLDFPLKDSFKSLGYKVRKASRYSRFIYIIYW